MPRHFADKSTAPAYFAQSDYATTNYSDETAIGKGLRPGYTFQSRGRYDSYQESKAKEPLRAGFEGFLCETESNDKIGDTARKHFAEVSGVESRWRPSFHKTPAVEHPVKGHGKRFGHPLPTGAGVETTDIPRGMRHIEPPKGKLADEMPLFDTLRGRVYNRDGVNLANAQSIPSESSYSEHPQRRHGQEGNRNGLPLRYPGDTNVAAVEFQPQFFDRAALKHRLGLEAPAKPFVKQNQFAEKEARMATQRDRSDVANLPKYPKPQSNTNASTVAHVTSALPPVASTSVGGGGAAKK